MSNRAQPVSFVGFPHSRPATLCPFPPAAFNREALARIGPAGSSLHRSWPPFSDIERRPALLYITPLRCYTSLHLQSL
jgi:hypothetical protein